MLRGLRSFAVASVALIALMVSGCTSDPGGSQGVLLDGDPDSLAIEAVKDFYNGDHITDAEVSEASNGARVVRTKIEIGFAADATVAEVNAVLELEEALITTMLEGVNLIVVRIPDPGSLDALSAAVSRLQSDASVVKVNKTYMLVPDELPDNYSAPDSSGLHYIDHHLAVRAHAAWNAKAALNGDHAEPPLLIVQDHFGDGAPNADFDVNASAGLFETNKPDFHGYHVLGIISARHGGGASDRGLATGIYPGTLDLYALDQQWLENETAEDLVVMQIKGASRNVIVNSSIGDLCEITLAECIVPGAREWIWKVRGKALYETGKTGPGSLENKFLHFTSAGNLTAPAPTEAELNSVYNTARLMAGLETEAGVSLDNLNNTLVIEDRDNSQDQPYTTVCISPSSKYPGDLSAVGTDVWSLTGSSSGAGELDGTSMAAPQAAGLAAYVWALAPDLTPQELLWLLANTARDEHICPPEGATPQPVIDAYNAVLAVDDASALSGGGTLEAAVRLAILDIVGGNKGSLGGDGAFDEVDVERFLDEVTWTAGHPDYSRFDLNGDGYTGGETTEKFNLDIDPALQYSEVTQEIKGDTVSFDESALTDLKILCYYAYSELYTGNEEKRDTLFEPWIDQCRSGCEPPPEPDFRVSSADDFVQAIEDASDGDVILLEPGTYTFDERVIGPSMRTGAFRVDKSLTLMGAGPGQTTMRVEEQYAYVWMYTLDGSEIDHVTVRDLSFVAEGATQAGFNVFDDVNHLTFCNVDMMFGPAVGAAGGFGIGFEDYGGGQKFELIDSSVQGPGPSHDPSRGVEINVTGAGLSLDVLVQGSTISGWGSGLEAYASGGAVLDIDIDNCDRTFSNNNQNVRAVSDGEPVEICP